MGKPRTQPPPPSGLGQPAGHLCTWGRAVEGWGQRGAVGMSGGSGKAGGRSGGLSTEESGPANSLLPFQVSVKPSK